LAERRVFDLYRTGTQAPGSVSFRYVPRRCSGSRARKTGPSGTRHRACCPHRPRCLGWDGSGASGGSACSAILRARSMSAGARARPDGW